MQVPIIFVERWDREKSSWAVVARAQSKKHFDSVPDAIDWLLKIDSSLWLRLNPPKHAPQGQDSMLQRWNSDHAVLLLEAIDKRMCRYGEVQCELGNGRSVYKINRVHVSASSLPESPATPVPAIPVLLQLSVPDVLPSDEPTQFSTWFANLTQKLTVRFVRRFHMSARRLMPTRVRRPSRRQ